MLWIRIQIRSVFSNFVDQDPNWIPFQQLCGSGSAFGIQIRIHTGKNKKNSLYSETLLTKNFFQCHYVRLDFYKTISYPLVWIKIWAKLWIRIQILCSWNHKTGLLLFHWLPHKVKKKKWPRYLYISLGGVDRHRHNGDNIRTTSCQRLPLTPMYLPASPFSIDWN